MAAIPLFGHTEMLHTPIGMGSAALAAAVRGPEFHGRDNEVLKTNKNFFFFFFLLFFKYFVVCKCLQSCACVSNCRVVVVHCFKYSAILRSRAVSPR